MSAARPGTPPPLVGVHIVFGLRTDNRQCNFVQRDDQSLIGSLQMRRKTRWGVSEGVGSRISSSMGVCVVFGELIRRQ